MGVAAGWCLSRENIEHDPKLTHRTPQPMLLAVDDDDYFVKMPFVAEGLPSCPNALSGLLTKL